MGLTNREMANLGREDYLKYSKGDPTGFFISSYDAQKRIFLEDIKIANPGKKVKGPFWDYGFIPNDCYEFDERLDIERKLIDRKIAKNNKDYAKADEIKKQLKYWMKNIEINDNKDGVDWIIFP